MCAYVGVYGIIETALYMKAQGRARKKLLQFISQFMTQVLEAQHRNTHPRPPDQPVYWQPPDEGILKINFDASVVKAPPSIGLGVVARNNNGEVLAWIRCRLPFIQDSELAKHMQRTLLYNSPLSFMSGKLLLMFKYYSGTTIVFSLPFNFKLASLIGDI